ncbi:hypothetical protein OSSY52_09200 [Tepiditoga spiralis]|uniref:Fis family transcriptional regulator n=1 Tax=Tepiditoga spiralis TaxID=2108365 RepID=A0A7G1GB10_9BACT|nr:SoxR reducing system RseC family protein [Tepiditoga spiralis]BBE30779.1 hypothetical protein OSSY52_09200 [Tepiditoga spiralis]
MREIMSVIEVKDKYVYLLTQRAGECDSCELHGACSITGGPDLKIRAKRNENLELKEGDTVVVELPKVSITKMSFVVYGLPLIVFLSFTILFYLLGFGDVKSFLFGLTSMAITYTGIAIYDRKKLKDSYFPEIIDKINTPTTFKVINPNV